MFTKMQDAFTKAGEQNSVVPIHMFYREWAVIVEIERHPETARRLHAAEQALMSDDPAVRDAAIATAGAIARAAHKAVDESNRWMTGTGRSIQGSASALANCSWPR
jgi:hypothetical protein